MKNWRDIILNLRSKDDSYLFKFPPINNTYFLNDFLWVYNILANMFPELKCCTPVLTWGLELMFFNFVNQSLKNPQLTPLHYAPQFNAIKYFHMKNLEDWTPNYHLDAICYRNT